MTTGNSFNDRINAKRQTLSADAAQKLDFTTRTNQFLELEGKLNTETSRIISNAKKISNLDNDVASKLPNTLNEVDRFLAIEFGSCGKLWCMTDYHSSFRGGVVPKNLLIDLVDLVRGEYKDLPVILSQIDALKLNTAAPKESSTSTELAIVGTDSQAAKTGSFQDRLDKILSEAKLQCFTVAAEELGKYVSCANGNNSPQAIQTCTPHQIKSDFINDACSRAYPMDTNADESIVTLFENIETLSTSGDVAAIAVE